MASDPEMSISLDSAGGLRPDWDARPGSDQGNQAEQKSADSLADVSRILEDLVSATREKRSEVAGGGFSVDKSSGLALPWRSSLQQSEHIQHPGSPPMDAPSAAFSWEERFSITPEGRIRDKKNKGRFASQEALQDAMANVDPYSISGERYPVPTIPLVPIDRSEEIRKFWNQEKVRHTLQAQDRASSFIEEMADFESSAPSASGGGGGSRRRGTASGSGGDDERKSNQVRGPNISEVGKVIHGLSHAIPQLGPGAGLGQAGLLAGGALGLGAVGSGLLAAGLGVGGAALGYEAMPHFRSFFAERDTFRDEFVRANQQAAIARSFRGEGPDFGVPEITKPENLINEIDTTTNLGDKITESELRLKEASERVNRLIREEISAMKHLGPGGQMPEEFQERVLEAQEREKTERENLNRLTFLRDQIKGASPQDIIPITRESLGKWGTLSLLQGSLEARGVDTRFPEDYLASDKAGMARFHRTPSDEDHMIDPFMLDEARREGKGEVGPGLRDARVRNTIRERDMEGRAALRDRARDAILDMDLKELEKFDNTFEDMIQREIDRAIDPQRFHFGSFAYGGLTA